MNPLSNLDKYNIVLGSASPRRKELLAGLGIPFEVKTVSGVDETYPKDIFTDDIPLYLSKLKSDAFVEIMLPDTLLITADTIVICDDIVMGKPKDAEDARKMLRQLSGNEHQVVSGVTIRTLRKSVSFKVSTIVEMAPMNENEIDYYISQYRPFDKAGAYGIQEWIGYTVIRGIRGSFYNVMGLPMQRLYEELRKF